MRRQFLWQHLFPLELGRELRWFHRVCWTYVSWERDKTIPPRVALLSLSWEWTWWRRIEVLNWKQKSCGEILIGKCGRGNFGSHHSQLTRFPFIPTPRTNNVTKRRYPCHSITRNENHVHDTRNNSKTRFRLPTMHSSEMPIPTPTKSHWNQLMYRV